jgi:hypothetical protein
MMSSTSSDKKTQIKRKIGHYPAPTTCIVGPAPGRAGIFGKVYFPRLIALLSIVISNLISFAIRRGVFLAFMLYFIIRESAVLLTPGVLALPALLLIMVYCLKTKCYFSGNVGSNKNVAE